MERAGDDAVSQQNAASAYSGCGVLALQPGATRIYVNFTDEPNRPNGMELWPVESVKDPENRNTAQGAIHTVFSGHWHTWTPLQQENPRRLLAPRGRNGDRCAVQPLRGNAGKSSRNRSHHQFVYPGPCHARSADRNAYGPDHRHLRGWHAQGGENVRGGGVRNRRITQARGSRTVGPVFPRAHRSFRDDRVAPGPGRAPATKKRRPPQTAEPPHRSITALQPTNSRSAFAGCRISRKPASPPRPSAGDPSRRMCSGLFFRNSGSRRSACRSRETGFPKCGPQPPGKINRRSRPFRICKAGRRAGPDRGYGSHTTVPARPHRQAIRRDRAAPRAAALRHRS